MSPVPNSSRGSIDRLVGAIDKWEPTKQAVSLSLARRTVEIRIVELGNLLPILRALAQQTKTAISNP